MTGIGVMTLINMINADTAVTVRGKVHDMILGQQSGRDMPQYGCLRGKLPKNS